jgi:hypothetical protein
MLGGAAGVRVARIRLVSERIIKSSDGTLCLLHDQIIGFRLDMLPGTFRIMAVTNGGADVYVEHFNPVHVTPYDPAGTKPLPRSPEEIWAQREAETTLARELAEGRLRELTDMLAAVPDPEPMLIRGSQAAHLASKAVGYEYHFRDVDSIIVDAVFESGYKMEVARIDHIPPGMDDPAATAAAAAAIFEAAYVERIREP